MEQAWGIIREMSADEQERAEAEAVEKARRDMVARLRSAKMEGLAEGKAEGLAEGKAEGRVEERFDSVTNMLAEGLTVEQISRYLHLSLDEVTSMAAKAKPLQ